MKETIVELNPRERLVIKTPQGDFILSHKEETSGRLKDALLLECEIGSIVLFPDTSNRVFIKNQKPYEDCDMVDRRWK